MYNIIIYFCNFQFPVIHPAPPVTAGRTRKLSMKIVSFLSFLVIAQRRHIPHSFIMEVMQKALPKCPLTLITVQGLCVPHVGSFSSPHQNSHIFLPPLLPAKFFIMAYAYSANFFFYYMMVTSTRSKELITMSHMIT